MLKGLFKSKKVDSDYLFRVTKDGEMMSKMDFKTLKNLNKSDLLSMMAFFESQLLIVERWKESKQTKEN